MIRTHVAVVLAAALAAFGASAPALAEVDEVKVANQYGIGYLPLTVMKADKLIEKHLAQAGLPGTKVAWVQFGAGAAANDALISGTLHFASGGTGPAFILWDKTKGNIDARGVAALSSMPNLLVSRNPAVKTIRDFTDKDRIAMAGAGSSVQTIYLQMAVAKEFGIANYKKLNPLMVNLPHPEGLAALLSGAADVTAQFTSPPFQYYALENPAIHTVLNSYDVMGGPNTFLMVWASSKFRDANPKVYKAFLAALNEATASINADKRRAAEIYVREGGNKDKVEEILKMMSDPQVRYTLAPERIYPYATFMHEVGSLKNKPASWKDLFFPEIHDLAGS